ncbi:MAG TPA: hypothetical protein VHE34_11240 [Puia sp.]|uniref:hypothetical protein n=1 Tax=Puia sp. TaxID=2045100 RepID=UPI002C8FBB21|nr:hypothetical protein [Puia sp.]HVU95792.1 hypothetical protein [Puia sp.]
MTVQKVNLYSLCFFVLLPVFFLCKFIVKHDFDWDLLSFLFFFIFMAWGIGILVGLGLSAAVKKPSAEPFLFLAGHFTVILTIVLLAGIKTYIYRVHQRDLENVNDNHSFVNLNKSSYEPYRLDYHRTAFLKLESGLNDPNGFRLEKYSCRWKDTVINSAPDTIYFVYFTYLKDSKALFAKVTVWGDSALINSMDSETKPDLDNEFTKAGPWGRNGDLESVQRSLKDLPDSTQKKVLDILSH